MKWLLILAMLFPSLARGAAAETEISERAKAMLAAYSKLVFQQGEIDLRQGLAKLKLAEGFRFLSAKDAKTVLVDFWGNSPDQHPLSSDHVAAYGLAALVAGGIAAKTGLLKMLLVGLLAAKKLVIVGVLAAGYAVKKLFAKKEC